jgi:hypothetical protein
MNVKEMMALVKMAGSGEVQAIFQHINTEVEDIKRDRVGLKAAMPIAIRNFEVRLDGLQKQMDDGFAGLAARLDAIMLLVSKDIPNERAIDSSNGHDTSGGVSLTDGVRGSGFRPPGSP